MDFPKPEGACIENPMSELTPEVQDKIEAAAFRRLLEHLDARKDVQNIDLMILADFCRNCLSRWYQEAAASNGVEVSQDQAREKIYGMPYAEWKQTFQTPATAAQIAAMEARKRTPGKH